MTHTNRQNDLKDIGGNGNISEIPPTEAGGNNFSDSAQPAKQIESKNGTLNDPILSDAPNLCNTNEGASMSAKFYPKPAYFESKHSVLDHKILFHRTMSDSAKLLVMVLNGIMTTTPNWVPTQCDIGKRMGWGREKMKRSVDELKDLGYLKITQQRETDGSFSTNCFEFDIDGGYLNEKQKNESNSSETKCPHNECEPLTGFPSTVNPSTVNPPLPNIYDSPDIKNKQSVLSVTRENALGQCVDSVHNSENPTEYVAHVNAGSKGVIKLTKDDLYAHIARKTCDWSTDEINYAWRALCAFSGIVHDWWRFIEGTVSNYRHKCKKSDEKSSNQEASNRHKPRHKPEQPTKTLQTQEGKTTLTDEQMEELKRLKIKFNIGTAK